MLSKNHPIILFIDRNGFTLFQDALTNIARFNFTPDLVANLDVVNKEQFSALITTFIQINKIVPSNMAVILSDNVIYLKNTEIKSDANEIQIFLENVPFEDILAKVIKTENVNSVVAVNKDLVMTIVDAFVKKGAVLDAVVPSFMYGQNVNFSIGLTGDNLKAILGNLEILRAGNLLTDQEKTVFVQSLELDQKNQSPHPAKKPQSLRQYILIGTFAALVVIFVVVYLNLGASQTSLPGKKIKNTKVNTFVSPTIVPTVVVSPVAVSTDLNSVKVKIVQNSQSEAIAVNLKNDLITAGFKDVASEISGEAVAEKSSIIFSQDIPVDIRNIIIAEINKTLSGISIVENQDSNFTIKILIGKS